MSAVIDHGHTDHHHGPASASQLAHHLENYLGAWLVEVVQWLIQKKNLRIVN